MEKMVMVKLLEGEMIQLSFSSNSQYIGSFYCDKLKIGLGDDNKYYIHIYYKKMPVFCVMADDYILNNDDSNVNECYRLDVLQ